MQGISLKELGLMFVPENFKNYFSGLMPFFILCIICTLWMMIRSRKDVSSRFLAVYTIFLALTIYNPFAVKLVFTHFNFDSVYYRFIWLLPVSIIPAYCVICLIRRFRSKALKNAAILILCGIIILIGQPNLSKERLKVPDNLYKMSDAVLAVSTMIHNDAPGETVTAAMHDQLNFSMRQYDPSIVLSINRDNLLCFMGLSDFSKHSSGKSYAQQEPLMQLLVRGEMIDGDELLKAVKDTETDYLVYPESLPFADYLSDLDFSYVGSTEGYAIFRTNIKANNSSDNN